jgi:hypothetical protein
VAGCCWPMARAVQQVTRRCHSLNRSQTAELKSTGGVMVLSEGSVINCWSGLLVCTHISGSDCTVIAVRIRPTAVERYVQTMTDSCLLMKEPKRNRHLLCLNHPKPHFPGLQWWLATRPLLSLYLRQCQHHVLVSLVPRVWTPAPVKSMEIVLRKGV